jgi:hypothetical protein
LKRFFPECIGKRTAKGRSIMRPYLLSIGLPHDYSAALGSAYAETYRPILYCFDYCHTEFVIERADETASRLLAANMVPGRTNYVGGREAASRQNLLTPHGTTGSNSGCRKG